MPRVTRSLQPYFKHDGSVKATGDFDLDSNKILNCAEIDVSLITRSLAGASMTIQPHWNKGYVVFRAYDGTAWRNCLFIGKVGEFHAMVDIPRLGDVTVLASKVLNFGSNPILYSPFKHICPFDLIGGATDVYIETIPSGEMTEDLHVDKVIVSIDQPAGAGKTVTVEISDGTNTMTVEITGDTDVKGSTTTNNFDLDVSAESLTLHYSQTAGGAATAGTIICLYHTITNV